MSDEQMAISMNRNLVYSPDDAQETGKGWYVHDYSVDKTSQLFATKQEAYDAHLDEKLTFD